MKDNQLKNLIPTEEEAAALSKPSKPVENQRPDLEKWAEEEAKQEDTQQAPVDEILAEAQEVEEEIPEPVKQEAKKYGHLTREQYIAKKGTDKGWKDEKEYVEYGKTYTEVQELRKSNNQMAKDLQTLVDAYKRQAEQKLQDARDLLERQLKEARDYGNVERVEQLTQQRVYMEQQQALAQQQQQQAEIQEADSYFTERNKHWYNSENPELLVEAQTRAKTVNASFPNLTYKQKAELIEQQMMLYHPELRPETKTTKAPSSHVSASESRVAKSMSDTVDPKLNQEYRKLSAIDRAEFQALKEQMASLKMGKNRRVNVEYSLKDYLASKQKQKERDNK